MTNTLFDNHGNIIMIFDIIMILVKNIHCIAICHIGSFESTSLHARLIQHQTFQFCYYSQVFMYAYCAIVMIILKLKYTETIMIGYIMKENIMILLYQNSVQLYCGVHIALKIVLVFSKQKHNFYV